MRNVRLGWLILRCGGLLTVAAAFGTLSAGAQVPAQDARNSQIVTTDTHLPLPHWESLQQWEARKASLRRQILVAAGLSPLPEKTPLHAEVFGKMEGPGYTIEKVLIETMPGFYLGGNLYRPRDGKTKHPGVLNPHGHWAYGRLENQPLYSGPSLGMSLARQGYVVFAYDMVGYTDTIQVPHWFGSAEQRLWGFGPLGLQLWDSIRALDFLDGLADVDAHDVGITGASGGATQAFLLAAVDDRLQFAAPVNMVSAIMQGGDLCENAPGLRMNTSNVEIAAMFAPKPMLVVSATGDWTRNVPKEEFPAIQRIYALYGKADATEVVQIHEEHNYNRLSREAVYRFFAKVHPGLSDSRELTEHGIDVPPLQDLEVLSNRTLPAHALDLAGVFAEWKENAEKQNAAMTEAKFVRDRLRQTLQVDVPGKVTADRDGERIVLGRVGRGDRVPGVSVEGKGRVAIVVNADGSAAAMQSDVVKKLRAEHRPILALDVFQTGAAKASRAGDAASGGVAPLKSDADDEEHADAAAGYPKFLTFNVSNDQGRVQDIVTAIAYASKDGGAADVYASGDAAVWATFAAALSPATVELHLIDVPKLASDDDYVRHFNVAGIRLAGGIGAAQSLLKGP